MPLLKCLHPPSFPYTEIRRILEASNEKLSTDSVKKLVKLAAEAADKEASRAVKPEIKPHFL